jgi:hypothetical protein
VAGSEGTVAKRIKKPAMGGVPRSRAQKKTRAVRRAPASREPPAESASDVVIID